MLNVMVSHKVEECNLEKFWEIETIGVETKKTNTEHEDFLVKYENSIAYHDNRYHAKLPWKTYHPPLPVNKTIVCKGLGM